MPPPKRKATSDASLDNKTPSKKSQTNAERKAEAHAKALAYKAKLDAKKTHKSQANKKKTSSSPAAASMPTEPPRTASPAKPHAQTKLAAPPAAIADIFSPTTLDPLGELNSSKRQSVDPDGFYAVNNRKESSEEGAEGPKQHGMEDAANIERNKERNNDGEELEGTSFAKRMGKRIMSVLFFGMLAQMAYGAFYLVTNHLITPGGEDTGDAEL
eukprot:scaffold44488_cov79-Cyclotella_meneghiniana.AAC.4